MLVRVAALVRLFHVVANGDWAVSNPDPPKRFARCGMLPARSLDRSADVPDDADALLNAFSEAEVEPGRKGLVVGVGLEVLEVSRAMFGVLFVTVGEMRDGSVPARPRRAGLLMPVSVKGTRSGKPSWFGDSGISNRGVEVPLVGGPQMFPVVPVGVCSSLVRFGKSLDAESCSGEPEPPLDSPAKALALGFGPLKGDLLTEEIGSTMGDSPDRLRFREPSARDAGPMAATQNLLLA